MSLQPVDTMNALPNNVQQRVACPCINRKLFISLFVGGLLLAIAGFFICLAANQYLPHGVNAISQLGIGGWCMGFIPMILGILMVGVSFPELCKTTLE